VLAVPRSMAMSFEMAPKSEEIMQGPGELGLKTWIDRRVPSLDDLTQESVSSRLRLSVGLSRPSALTHWSFQGLKSDR
jgi:hypothetical protein